MSCPQGPEPSVRLPSSRRDAPSRPPPRADPYVHSMAKFPESRRAAPGMSRGGLACGRAGRDGHRAAVQPVPVARILSLRLRTSNKPSTATAAICGSERRRRRSACGPCPLKAATISRTRVQHLRSSRKSGAELTKPPSRTTRTTVEIAEPRLDLGQRLCAAARRGLPLLTVNARRPSCPWRSAA